MSRPFNHNACYITGDAMSLVNRREALSRYVSRYTAEHIPAWARKEWKDGKPYPVQFASDSEWLAHTKFNILKTGKLAARACYTTGQTWPNNPELRSPV